MSAKHTPGPWKVSRLGQAGYPHVYDQTGARVATVETHGQWGGELLAFNENARLIAASPKLLEALKELHNYVDREVLQSFDKESRQEIREKMDRIVYQALKDAEGSDDE